MVDRRPAKDKSVMLRIAAGLAVAAVGATAIFDRGKRSHAEPALAPNGDFTSGRGTREGPVNAPSLAAGYEVEDTNIRLLAIIMIVSVSIMVGGTALVYWMFASFDGHFAAASRGLTAEQRASIVPPLPRLQAFPYRDIDAIVMEQKRRLATYGWDGGAGRQAHIPIERAMRQVVGKPLDASATVDAAGSPGTTQALPVLPDYNAAIAQDKPGNRIQGEGRPGAVAPSYRPAPGAKP